MDNYSVGIFGVLVVVFVVLAVLKRLPSMASVKDFADTINSAGGHILVLLVMVAAASRMTFRLFYHVLAMPETVTKQDALINMMFTFCTTTLIMLPLGALIKTMTGDKANGKPPAAPDTLLATVSPEK